MVRTSKDEGRRSQEKGKVKNLARSYLLIEILEPGADEVHLLIKLIQELALTVEFLANLCVRATSVAKRQR